MRLKLYKWANQLNWHIKTLLCHRIIRNIKIQPQKLSSKTSHPSTLAREITHSTSSCSISRWGLSIRRKRAISNISTGRINSWAIVMKGSIHKWHQHSISLWTKTSNSILIKRHQASSSISTRPRRSRSRSRVWWTSRTSKARTR